MGTVVSYPVAVIARRLQDFKDFTHWMEPEDRRHFVLITRADQLCGIIFSNVVRIGAYEKIPNHHEIYIRALTRIRGNQHG